MGHYIQHQKIAFFFIAPQLIVTILFFIWPACNALVQSFFVGDPFGLESHFAGWEHFLALLHSSDYVAALWTTLIISVFITLLTTGTGLALAMLVKQVRKGQMIYKALLIWPYAVAPAVAAILWRFLCHPTLGWMTRALHWIGMDFNYMVHPKQALAVIIMAASWQQCSYNFLFFFAALNRIPRSLLEAAIIDGASPWRRFWQIILPLLTPTIFFLMIMNFIYSFFDTFGIIDVITHGGPGYSTTSLIYKVYKDGFLGMDIGSASAQSAVLIVFVVLLTWLQFHYLEKRVHYQ